MLCILGMGRIRQMQQVLGTGLMQTTLFLEKLTIPIDFYKNYYLCNLEYFLLSLVAVTSYVLEGYPCYLTRQLRPCSFPCSKSYGNKSGLPRLQANKEKQP